MNSIWHQNPFTRIAIAFILGVLWAYFMEPVVALENSIAAGFLILLISIWLTRSWWRAYKLRYTFGLLISIVFVLAGYMRYSQYTRHHAIEELPRTSLLWKGMLEEYPIETANSLKLELKIFGYFTEDETHVLESNILAYAKQNSGFDTLAIGDELVFQGLIRPFETPINPEQFDYGAYLKRHGISGMVFLNKENTTVFRPENIPFDLILQFKKLQHHMVAILGRYGMSKSELGVASALILGYRSNIDPNVKKEYADAGVVHILAVSGLHVGIIYLVFEWLLSLLFKNKNWARWKLIILLFLLWSYAGITGFSPSVLRASTMFTFLAIGKEFQRYGSIYNMLAFSAVLLLIFDPSLLFEVGFQLSYIAVIGIALFFKPIHNLWFIKNKFLDKIWSLAAVSVAAQIATFPLAIYYFNQFPTYFLVSNILIIGLATVSLYTGLAAIAFSWLPGIDWVLLEAVEFLFFTLNSIVEWISHLPNAKIDFLYFRPITVILLYCLIGFLYKFFESPLKWKIWWPLSFALILVLFYTNRKLSVYNTCEVSVLQGSEQPITILQYGEKAWVKSSQSPDKFLEKEQFYIGGFRNLRGISQLNILPLEDTLIIGGISWIGDTLKVAVSQSELSKIGNANHLILTNEHTQIDSSSNALYLLNPAMYDFKKITVMSQLKDAKKMPWDLESQGIFSLRLD
jgi:competence protein ComEC